MDESVRASWTKEAQPVKITLEGVNTPLYLGAKVFKTGSIGWYLSQKVVLSDTPCQLSVCITAIGSKRTVTPEEVNGKTPYGEGFRPASDLRENDETPLTPPKVVRKRPAKP